MIVAGTAAVVLKRLSVYICVAQFAALGYQAAGNDHVVVGPDTEVVMSRISGPGLQEQ